MTPTMVRHSLTSSLLTLGSLALLACDGGNDASGGSAATGGTSTGGALVSDGGTGGGSTAVGGTPAASGGAGGSVAGTGGASTGGASTGGSVDEAGGSASGGSDNGGCGIEPVTPNATEATRKMLCFLHAQYGNHILSGQEENNDDNAANYILQTTGKYPAIRAFDVNNDKAPQQCVEHWQKGGLCMFGYHMGLVGGDGYEGSKTPTDINQVLTEGSELNKTFKQRLDKTAAMLETVQDAGGVAILRLFHEAGNGCGWFWWGADAGKFVRLWKYTFDYMTAQKGLENILWMVSLCGNPNGGAWNPGKQYTDFGGADTYAGNGNYDALNGLFKNTEAAFPGMPVALHECGPIPDPEQLKATGTKWLLFNVWTDNYPKPPSNSVEHLKAVYSSDYVLTRDEMPKF